MRALAASAALQFPVFRQLMGTIGAISADRKSAAACLKAENTLGLVHRVAYLMYVCMYVCIYSV